MTQIGYFFIGVLIGIVGGFIFGIVRERKGKNKK